MNYLYKIYILILLLCFVSTGCLFHTKKYEWKPVKEKKAPVVHIVQWKSETLSIIAKWYTGESGNWEAIFDANPNINPESLPVNTKIYIPPDLVKSCDPMPNRFVTDYYQQLKNKKPKKVKPQKQNKSNAVKKTEGTSTPEDDFEVFGPK